jgi:hypothetical protein
MIGSARLSGRGSWYDQSVLFSEYLKEYVGPNDYIYNLGRDAQIYFYTKTRSPTRFLTDRGFGYDPETLKETCRDFAINKPKLIINTLRPPYFSEEWANYIWSEIKKCGKLEIERKEEVYFAEVWFLK